MRIGVFDSGIGGLTVLKSLLNRFPNNEYIYYGDTKNIPYGDKTINELKVLACNIINFLNKKSVDFIVIACGTISSNLSTYLKEKYDVEIIDIITPTINFLNSSKYQKIGVLATKATINSNVFNTIVNKDIKQVACPKFVPLIEKSNMLELDEYINLYLKELKDREIIILGCTHYPIIKDKISKCLNNNTKLLDMSECINNITNIGNRGLNLYFSKLDDDIINNIYSIIGDKKISINLAEEIM